VELRAAALETSRLSKRARRKLEAHWLAVCAPLAGDVVPEGVEDEAAMEQADALAIDAAEALTEAFAEFLFPDATDVDEPQA
jgi:hypothetical protein